MMKINRLGCIIALMLCVLQGYAQAPKGYYDSCEGLTERALLQELSRIIGPHTNVGYKGLWTLYKSSDVREDGTIWDMYSTASYRPGKDQCGSYHGMGDCYNREHSFPKSWFDDAEPMHSDAYHIYPTDGKVNSQRSNYPFGECKNGTVLSPVGNVRSLGKLGSSTFPGYSGKVFEPHDDYKGDFARSYFYMAACYNSRISSFHSPMLAGNNYPCYTTWAVNLLLKWHRQDPVSDKELQRNEAVSKEQRNRNPFIDYPNLAEYIWGEKKGQGWTPDGAAASIILSPSEGENFDLGATAINVTKSADIVVKGRGLNENVSVQVAGNGFSASSSSLAFAEVNSTNGKSLKVNYLSAKAGQATGTVTLISGANSVQVNVKAVAYDGLPADEATDITQSSFMVHWMDVDQKAGTTYQLKVYKEGALVSGYPKAVKAADQQYKVTGLEPSTTYTYTVSSAHFTSNIVTVTTSAPVPVLYIIAKNFPNFVSEPEVASEPIEVEIYTEYVEGDITVTVTEPFGISLDKASWSQSLTVDELGETLFLRMNGCKEGMYSALMNATSSNCEAEPLEIVGRSSLTPAFFEDFEADATGMNSYRPAKPYQGTASIWKFSDAGIFESSESRDKHNGKQGVRLGKSADSSIEMTEDKSMGVGTVTFYAAAWGNEKGTVQVQYSTDKGTNWKNAGIETTVDEASLTQNIVTVNASGNVRVRLLQTSGKRLCIDDISLSDYQGTGIAQEELQTWSAYCRNHQLVVETTGTDHVAVYSADGMTCYNDVPGVSELSLSLPEGLYIVVVNEGARRVIVK